MCGICGEYEFLGQGPANLADLQKRTMALAHRGPDDEGYFCRGPIGLGFRRLSIIDLAAGRQPMTDSEQKVWVVFNGEIYNFPELRSELKQFGHRFRTRSDTEVILHGYKQWGVDVLDRLNGMFGLAVWDEANGRLMLARDRLGIKPLYYRLTPDRIIFASEIRAITACDTAKPRVDEVALHLFLRYRYTPAPLTPFHGIRKLAAGTRLVVEKGVPRLERWWNFHPAPFDPMPSPQEAEEALIELYRKAVKRQLISDVPLGLFLSGGLDSGLLLALMTETRSDWKTYSIGFGTGFAQDELSRAGATARAFNSHNVPITLSQRDFENSLSLAISAVEEPVAADSIVPMFFLCQRARKDVKVALMGQGPDELFGGYRRHLFTRYGAYIRSLPECSQFLARAGLRYTLGKTTADRILAALTAKDSMAKYLNTFSQLPADCVGGLFRNAEVSATADDEIRSSWRDLQQVISDTDELGGLQCLEVRSSLPDELLLYADKLSMAHGLEVRVPYLDHEIVEYVERLPSAYKVRNGSRKWLHRKACRRLLPTELLSRDKIGFETPSGEWFRLTTNATVSEFLGDPQSKLYEYLRHEAVETLLLEHQTGKSTHPDLLFSLVALEAWLRISCN